MIKLFKKLFKPKYKIPEKSFAEIREETEGGFWYKPENCFGDKPGETVKFHNGGKNE